MEGGIAICYFYAMSLFVFPFSTLPIFLFSFSPPVQYFGRENGRRGLGCYGGESPDWEKRADKNLGDREGEKEKEDDRASEREDGSRNSPARVDDDDGGIRLLYLYH